MGGGGGEWRRMGVCERERGGKGPKHSPVTGATPISDMIAALLLGITTKLSNILSRETTPGEEEER